MAHHNTPKFFRAGVLLKGVSASSAVNLAPLANNDSVDPMDVSETGTVAGFSTKGGVHTATAWVGGKPVSLGPRRANGISSNGNSIVGWRIVGNLRTAITHAMIFGKKEKDLGTLGGLRSIAYAVNNSGFVVGSAANTFGKDKPFFYDGKKMIDVAPNYEVGKAMAINDVGVLTGDINNHAFVYNSKTKALKALKDGTVRGKAGGESHGLDINNSGQIVGYSWIKIGVGSAATLWDGGVPVDLNTRIPAKSGWNLEYAKAINDKGQILAMGTLNGFQHAALLTPNRAAVSSGTLRVAGSPVADVVSVAVKGSKINVTVNGGTQSFSKSTIKRLSVDLGEGSDTLTIGAGVPAANVYGRGGNDTFKVRNGIKDVLDGGTGADRGQIDKGDTRVSVETLLA
jgi:probable HAF family extracellular repeat protein